MRTTSALVLALVCGCVETQPLPSDPMDDMPIDARLQSRADARVPSDAREQADAGPGGSDGCGSLTSGGRCTGTTLTWCSSGEVRSIDCSATDKPCTCDGDFCDCAEAGVGGTPDAGTAASGCGSVSFNGQCSGNTLRYCEGNQLHTVDCSAYGLYCDCPPFDVCDCWSY